MSPEQRLDRLERIAKLFVSAGLRARSNIRLHDEAIRDHRESLREQDEKINILITMQIQSEERFNERFARSEERFERIQQTIERLVGAQSRTEGNLQALIEALGGTNPGGSLA